jgi:hypothetical protein
MTPLEHTLLDLVTADQLAELPLAAARALAQASDDDARLEVLVALARLRRFLDARHHTAAAAALAHVVARGRLRLPEVQAREAARRRAQGDRWVRYAALRATPHAALRATARRAVAPEPADTIELVRTGGARAR